jgi:hypothetical protein
MQLGVNVVETLFKSFDNVGDLNKISSYQVEVAHSLSEVKLMNIIMRAEANWNEFE